MQTICILCLKTLKPLVTQEGEVVRTGLAELPLFLWLSQKEKVVHLCSFLKTPLHRQWCVGKRRERHKAAAGYRLSPEFSLLKQPVSSPKDEPSQTNQIASFSSPYFSFSSRCECASTLHFLTSFSSLTRASGISIPTSRCIGRSLILPSSKSSSHCFPVISAILSDVSAACDTIGYFLLLGMLSSLGSEISHVPIFSMP